MMWVHIVIFMLILGAFLAGKLGRLPPWADNAEGQKLFVLVALAGNIIGMLLTFQSGGGTVYSSKQKVVPVAGFLKFYLKCFGHVTPPPHDPASD